MIVKIWPIKADYGGKRGKVGGMEGLKNTAKYIQDPSKTEAIQLRQEVMDTRKDSIINREQDIQKVIRYMANEDKIERKYISGYHCSPESAVQEFENTMAHFGRKAKGNIAYHMVQSFPEDLDISDEEVHQCGLELCKKLKLYQAIVCSHVHPVMGDDGVMHGVSKHNHILFCAYPLPYLRDPKERGAVKYHNCKNTYRQLQIWNDEIALDHGLPIIRNPDRERVYSWHESNSSKQKNSWKERICLDIENARKETENWKQFAEVMKEQGYLLREGTQVTYLAPDGVHKARGNTLGKAYTREGLENYWKLRAEMLQSIDEEVKRNTPSSLLAFVKTGAKSIAVPLGHQGLTERTVHQLALDRAGISEAALASYFASDARYDVYDGDGNVIGAVSGEDAVAYYRDLDSDESRNIRAAEEDERNAQEENQRWLEQEKKKKDENARYYTNPLFRDSRTNRPYRVRYYDQYGNRMSNLEVMFALAVVALKNEEGLWIPSTIPPDKMNEIVYAPTDWKAQNMMDSIFLAREEGVGKPADVDYKLQETGAAFSRAKAALSRNLHVKEKMEDLKNAIVDYENYQQKAQALYSIPDGPEKEAALKEHAQELKQFSDAKAVMYAHGFKDAQMEEQIMDFKIRWRHVTRNLEEAENRFSNTKESYRRLKKLKYNMALAENPRYCYGPEYTQERAEQRREMLGENHHGEKKQNQEKSLE